MSSKNTFDCKNGNVYISHTGWNRLAVTTYREDYYDELVSVTWSDVNGYLCNKRYGYLHRYIMKKWYGSDVLSEMDKHDMVVDHMNGDKYDCRISNLEFLLKRYNTAKGQTVDVDSKELRMHLALTICKDFLTGCYQIHLGCNDNIFLYNTVQNKSFQVSVIRLLYNCDYRIVINDAEQILYNYDLEKQVNLSLLQCVDMKFESPIEITLNKGEENQPIIERNGKYYAAIGNGIWFYGSNVDEGWVPPQKKK